MVGEHAEILKRPAADETLPSLPYGAEHMSWKAPKIVEIALGAEINTYACAEAKGEQQ